MGLYAFRVNTFSLLDTVAKQPLPLLILDFDGTVCLGDGPVLAYADAAATFLPESARQELKDAVDAFLSHDPEAAAYKDGYAAVAALAGTRVSHEQLDWAYAESRRRLASGEVEISTAPGLASFLESLSGKVLRVLLTNAPVIGVHESLTKLGLADVVDAVVPEAGKPENFTPLLTTLLAHRAPYELMSVGDVWLNDIEPALRAGCATAFIDRFEHRTGAANLSATHFELLYPGITAWASHPEKFSTVHPSSTNHPDNAAPLPEKAQL
ncbi:hypothetical protein GCM10025779_02140 [Arthrobacter cryoconiti]